MVLLSHSLKCCSDSPSPTVSGAKGLGGPPWCPQPHPPRLCSPSGLPWCFPDTELLVRFLSHLRPVICETWPVSPAREGFPDPAHPECLSVLRGPIPSSSITDLCLPSPLYTLSLPMVLFCGTGPSETGRDNCAPAARCSMSGLNHKGLLTCKQRTQLLRVFRLQGVTV